jgi:hypothetical protein
MPIGDAQARDVRLTAPSPTAQEPPNGRDGYVVRQVMSLSAYPERDQQPEGKGRVDPQDLPITPSAVDVTTTPSPLLGPGTSSAYSESRVEPLVAPPPWRLKQHAPLRTPTPAQTELLYFHTPRDDAQPRRAHAAPTRRSLGAKLHKTQGLMSAEPVAQEPTEFDRRASFPAPSPSDLRAHWGTAETPSGRQDAIASDITHLPVARFDSSNSSSSYSSYSDTSEGVTAFGGGTSPNSTTIHTPRDEPRLRHVHPMPVLSPRPYDTPGAQKTLLPTAHQPHELKQEAESTCQGLPTHVRDVVSPSLPRTGGG